MGSEPTKEKEKRERRKEEKCSESVEHDLTKEKKEKREKSKRGVYDMIYYITLLVEPQNKKERKKEH